MSGTRRTDTRVQKHTAVRAVIGSVAVIAVIAIVAALVADVILLGPFIASGWDGLKAPISASNASAADDLPDSATSASADATEPSDEQTSGAPFLAFSDQARDGRLFGQPTGTTSSTSTSNGGTTTPKPAPASPDDPNAPDPDDPDDAAKPSAPPGTDDAADPDDPAGVGEPDQDDDPPVPHGGWVWGIVTDAATGEPVPGLILYVQGTSAWTTTGPSGIYVLSHLPPNSAVHVHIATGGTAWRTRGAASVSVHVPEEDGARLDFQVISRGRR
jgi:hypothetical protein